MSKKKTEKQQKNYRDEILGILNINPPWTATRKFLDLLFKQAVESRSALLAEFLGLRLLPLDQQLTEEQKEAEDAKLKELLKVMDDFTSEDFPKIQTLFEKIPEQANILQKATALYGYVQTVDIVVGRDHATSVLLLIITERQDFFSPQPSDYGIEKPSEGDDTLVYKVAQRHPDFVQLEVLRRNAHVDDLVELAAKIVPDLSPEELRGLISWMFRSAFSAGKNYTLEALDMDEQSFEFVRSGGLQKLAEQALRQRAQHGGRGH